MKTQLSTSTQKFEENLGVRQINSATVRVLSIICHIGTLGITWSITNALKDQTNEISLFKSLWLNMLGFSPIVIWMGVFFSYFYLSSRGELEQTFRLIANFLG